MPYRKNKPQKIFPSDDDFLTIFLPMIDDEELRRLLETEEEEEDPWGFEKDDSIDEKEEMDDQRNT